MEYKTSPKPLDYLDSVAEMERRAEAIAAGEAEELLWFVEHPPLYTAGSSAKGSDVLTPRFPVYETGRGGQVTYHGPGQRVAYTLLDLKRREAMDIRAYVQDLERWLIATLARFGVEGFIREGRVGVWTQGADGGEAKIAALGIRVRKWVTYHGISLNVNPDLSHYAGIVPCGIREYGVTSLAALGVSASMAEVDAALKAEFDRVFS